MKRREFITLLGGVAIAWHARTITAYCWARIRGAANKHLGVVFMMTLKLKTLFLILPALFFLSPICAAEFTYKEYTKASESWRRGFVFGISRYMSTVAQPRPCQCECNAPGCRTAAMARGPDDRAASSRRSACEEYLHVGTAR